MNRSTISPPIPALYRTMCDEIVDRESFMNHGDLSMSGGRFVPLHVFFHLFMCLQCQPLLLVCLVYCTNPVVTSPPLPCSFLHLFLVYVDMSCVFLLCLVFLFWGWLVGSLIDWLIDWLVGWPGVSGFAPWGAIGSLASALIFGTGGACQDADTLEVLAKPVADVTEVAGAEAYAKCGFDTAKIK